MTMGRGATLGRRALLGMGLAAAFAARGISDREEAGQAWNS